MLETTKSVITLLTICIKCKSKDSTAELHVNRYKIGQYVLHRLAFERSLINVTSRGHLYQIIMQHGGQNGSVEWNGSI